MIMPGQALSEPAPGYSSGGLLLKQLDAFCADYHAVHPLGYQEADLAVAGVEFVQPLHRTALSVSDPVVGVIAKAQRQRAGGDRRHIGRGVDGIAEETVGLAGHQGGLPEILAVGILEFAQRRDRGLVRQE